MKSAEPGSIQAPQRRSLPPVVGDPLPHPSRCDVASVPDCCRSERLVVLPSNARFDRRQPTAPQRQTRAPSVDRGALSGGLQPRRTLEQALSQSPALPSPALHSRQVRPLAPTPAPGPTPSLIPGFVSPLGRPRCQVGRFYRTLSGTCSSGLASPDAPCTRPAPSLRDQGGRLGCLVQGAFLRCFRAPPSGAWYRAPSSGAWYRALQNLEQCAAEYRAPPELGTGRLEYPSSACLLLFRRHPHRLRSLPCLSTSRQARRNSAAEHNLQTFPYVNQTCVIRGEAQGAVASRTSSCGN